MDAFISSACCLASRASSAVEFQRRTVAMASMPVKTAVTAAESAMMNSLGLCAIQAESAPVVFCYYRIPRFFAPVFVHAGRQFLVSEIGSFKLGVQEPSRPFRDFSL